MNTYYDHEERSIFLDYNKKNNLIFLNFYRN